MEQAITFVKKAEDSKYPQDLVVYLTPEENCDNKDFVCGACALRVKGNEDLCAVLYKSEMGTPLDISQTKGSCCLYVGGEACISAAPASISSTTAGYVEEGPYSCKRCNNFAGEGECTNVQSKPRGIDPDGCCDGWEKSVDLKES